jgi:hypothetical protein
MNEMPLLPTVGASLPLLVVLKSEPKSEIRSEIPVPKSDYPSSKVAGAVAKPVGALRVSFCAQLVPLPDPS